jgi:iron(III) transport system permease protein
VSRRPPRIGVRGAVLGVLIGFPLVAVAAEGLQQGGAARLFDATNVGYVWNSVVLGATVVVFATLLAAPFACVVAFRRFPLRGALEVAALAPLLVPLHVHAIGWMRIFGRQGLITQWLASTTGYVHDARAPWFANVYAGPAWILACSLFPLIAFPTSAGLRALDAEALDAARLAGASRARVALKIILPAVSPSYAAGAFLVFALSIGSFAATSLLDTPVLTQRIFFAFSRIEEGLGGAALQSFPLLLAAACAAYCMPGRLAVRGEALTARLRPRRSGLGATLSAAAPLLLAAGPPLYGLAAKIAEAGARAPGSPSPFRVVFAQVRTEFANSFLLSISGAAALLVVGWLLAWSFARRPSPRLESALAGSVALPPIVLGVGVLAAWKLTADVPGLGAVYASGGLLVILAYVGRFLPLVVRAFSGAFGAEAAAQDDAARLAGASRMRRAMKVLLPAQWGLIAGVAAVAYALCFVELDATLMTYSGDLRTVQVRIFNMVHYSRDEEVAALCLLSVGAALIPPALVALLRRRREARS